MKRFLFFFMAAMAAGNIQAAVEPGKTYRIVPDVKLDCYEATNDADLLAVYEKCYYYMRYHVGASWNAGTIVAGYDWFGYDFNDDVMWLVIAAIRGYQATGKQMYLDDAKRRFDCIRCV